MRSKTPIDAVLFDMDGLIFDTEGLYKECWQKAASEQALTISDAFYQNFIGVQDPECERMLVEHLGDEFDLARFRTVRDKYIHSLRLGGVSYKAGFHQLFDVLKNQGLRCALVTSSHLPEVRLNFSDSGYLSQFDIVVTAEDVENGKPHPDCYLLACERLRVTPERTLVLEDSNNGVRAGLDAGSQVAMIPDLLPPREDISKSANYIFSTLNDVIPLLT